MSSGREQWLCVEESEKALDILDRIHTRGRYMRLWTYCSGRFQFGLVRQQLLSNTNDSGGLACCFILRNVQGRVSAMSA